SALAEGFVLPRGTALRTVLGKGERTACEYRTGQDAVFWPIELTEAKYFGTAGALATVGVERLEGVRAGIRLSFRTAGGLAFDQLGLDRLRLFLKGTEGLPGRVYEQLLGNARRVLVRPKGGAHAWRSYLPASSLEPVGFAKHEALLPYTRRSFQGYRFLQEYFAFPQRFLFVDFTGLGPQVARCPGTELEFVVLLSRRDPELEDVLDAEHFALNCAPIVNLFSKQTDRIHLSDREHEYHVVPDRTRPMDFEVWSIEEVQGFGASSRPEQVFHPLYAQHDWTRADDSAYFTLRREPRLISAQQRRRGPRSSYVGSEVFLALVDPNEAPYRSSLKQLGITALCSNRDLPLHASFGQGRTDFTLDIGAPVESIRCVAGPTRPRPSHAHGDTAWRLVSHLSLNYLSLVDSDSGEGAEALRSLLSLYCDQNDQVALRQIEGVKSVVSAAVSGRIPAPGPIAFGRGLEVRLTCDESAFEGTGLFLFGQVLEGFLAKYVSINSFTETVLSSVDRGEVMRWQPRLGRQQRL
ncbi:MAG TPA: type VI secretion system baseplate subunit TssF, partial [Gammaproteobacteria bacterium]|nr:type VI secretion system baseplate subunit TssF [Gammaproteobacteria bacterium]